MELRALLEGGVDVAQVHHRLNVIEEELRENKTAVKGLARMVFNLDNTCQALLEALVKARERAGTNQMNFVLKKDI